MNQDYSRILIAATLEICPFIDANKWFKYGEIRYKLSVIGEIQGKANLTGKEYTIIGLVDNLYNLHLLGPQPCFLRSKSHIYGGLPKCPKYKQIILSGDGDLDKCIVPLSIEERSKSCEAFEHLFTKSIFENAEIIATVKKMENALELEEGPILVKPSIVRSVLRNNRSILT